jgi:sugar/nucleoside kinase (ribokinase family)
MDAALGDDWEIVPLVKVGRDVAAEGRALVASLRRAAPDASLVEVPEPNNRSELRYLDDAHRTEFMSGGVPGWTWEELGPRLAEARLDALYVNFLSGWEIDLAVAERVRAAFAGPIYVDLHMMLWAVQPSGRRALRPLARAAEWCRCFDLVQVNEEEMAMLAPDADALAALALAEGARCTVVTLGPGGVVYHAAPGFARLADAEPRRAHRPAGGVVVPAESARSGPDVDPTGCGDVWGATAFARLLSGDALPDALRAANRAAGRNAEHHGVAGLSAHLAGDGVAR